MNVGFGFPKIINESLHSLIITSGTLASLDGVESELKIKLTIKLENKYVIEKNQIHFGLITCSKYDKNENFLFVVI